MRVDARSDPGEQVTGFERYMAEICQCGSTRARHMPLDGECQDCCKCLNFRQTEDRLVLLPDLRGEGFFQAIGDYLEQLRPIYAIAVAVIAMSVACGLLLVMPDVLMWAGIGQ
jgi:hypothetical protein